MFQSTLPRRERRICLTPPQRSHSFNPRSREGSDIFLFPPTSLPPVSIHAPAKGATLIGHLSGADPFPVSIHAPAKGATMLPRKMQFCSSGFNPRSREGSDGRNSLRRRLEQEFQSTLPRRERQVRGVFCTLLLLFQSTLPRRERRHSTETSSSG